MLFHSFFWDGVPLSPELRRAVETLNTGTTPDDERLRVFTSLLTSDNVAARGIALDHVSQAEAQSRQGDVDRAFLEAVRPDVQRCARRELASPPYVRTDEDADPERGANHASAFYAMWHLATPDDAPLLADALLANDDPVVLEYGVTAAGVAVFRKGDVDARLASVLQGIATNPRLPSKLRAEAVVALGDSDSDAVTPWLEHALDDRNVAVSGAAACVLLERDPNRFRTRIEAAAAAWPAETPMPFHAWEVQKRLKKRS